MNRVANKLWHLFPQVTQSHAFARQALSQRQHLIRCTNISSRIRTLSSEPPALTRPDDHRNNDVTPISGLYNSENQSQKAGLRLSEAEYTEENYSENFAPHAGKNESKEGYVVTEVESNRAENTNTYSEAEVTVTGRDAPKPFIHFSEFKWPEEVSTVLERGDFKVPTAIQSQGLPIAMEGRDLVGIAQTGSGKTLAYIIPAVVRLREVNHQEPFALVLGPTRELVQQIQSVAAQFPMLRSVALYGGSAKGHQIAELRRRPRMVIATPGRLCDLADAGYIRLDDIQYLVIDEADRMLDMGFEPQIRNILARLPQGERQTLMWSATWPEDVKSLAEEFLNDYIQVNVGSTELHANHNIRQHVLVMHDEDKSNKLLEILGQHGKNDKVLIFAATKRRVDSIVSGLRRRGYRVDGTHGDKTQSQRENILRAFRTQRLDILVATDVAARGLDVDDIKVVINYDFPNTVEDYVHRIGRTGRKDKKGTSYTFMTHDCMAQAADLIEVLQEAGQEVPQELIDLKNAAISAKMSKKAFRDSNRKREFYGDQVTSGRYRHPRYVNRHNPSRDDDRTYREFGESHYGRPGRNQSPSSYTDDFDMGSRRNDNRRQYRRNDDDDGMY